MCAIFGSPSFDRFKELYRDNLGRGHSAFGMLYAEMQPTLGVAVGGVKVEGIATFEGQSRLPNNPIVFLGETINAHDTFFLGHTQAPTSAAQKFDPSTSHPFMYRDWVVAHNGVLTNYDELADGLNPFSYNIVDSSLIPALLADFEDKHRECPLDPDAAVVNVLARLKGTHATWIYNRYMGKFYIARCGSTLYADLNHGTFSSTPQPGMTLVPDGELYLYKHAQLTIVGNFAANSPFFIL